MQHHAYGRALSAYREIGRESGIAAATPHRLIALLMEGALERIARAKGCMGRGETALKGECIGRAISIIEGLRVSLNKEAGGEIAGNLDSLYDYMTRRLLQANVTGDPGLLDEVATLLNEIKSAWDAVPDKLEQAPAHACVAAGAR